MGKAKDRLAVKLFPSVQDKIDFYIRFIVFLPSLLVSKESSSASSFFQSLQPNKSISTHSFHPPFILKLGFFSFQSHCPPLSSFLENIIIQLTTRKTYNTKQFSSISSPSNHFELEPELDFEKLWHLFPSIWTFYTQKCSPPSLLLFLPWRLLLLQFR